jgi:hypothetical protein
VRHINGVKSDGGVPHGKHNISTTAASMAGASIASGVETSVVLLSLFYAGRFQNVLEMQNKVAGWFQNVLEMQNRVAGRFQNVLEVQNRVAGRFQNVLEMQNRVVGRFQNVLEMAKQGCGKVLTADCNCRLHTFSARFPAGLLLIEKCF